MGTKLSDDERNGLSDEELEALDDVEDGAPAATAGDSEGDGENENDAGGTASDDAGDPDDDGSGDDGEGAPPAGESEAAAAPAADAGGDGAGDAQSDAVADEVEQTLEVPPIALVDVPDVANYEAERGVLLDERKQLRQQHRDGDISSDEYDDKLDALNDKLNALDRTKADADAAQRQNEAVQRSQYMWTIDQVKKDFVKADAIDYDKNPVLMGMWDANVKALAKDEANASKSAEWFLRKAHQQVKDEIAKVAGTMGFTKGDAPKPKETPAEAKAASKTAVKDAVKARAKTAEKLKGVGELPAASSDDVSGDEFAGLDGLSGLELEHALARMPEERAAKYLKG